jgi:hypothetical protein
MSIKEQLVIYVSVNVNLREEAISCFEMCDLNGIGGRLDWKRPISGDQIKRVEFC